MNDRIILRVSTLTGKNRGCRGAKFDCGGRKRTCIVAPAMAGTRPSPAVRAPAVAGMFYPAGAEACQQAAQSLLRDQKPTADGQNWRGAIVPHAGWICSGAIAAQSIATLAQANPSPDVVVVFGAVHTPVDIEFAALDVNEVWAVPGGQTRLASDAMRELTSVGNLFAVEERLHRHEHAIEVELPLIQQAWPNAMLLPIEVPAIDVAVEIGRETARRIALSGSRTVFLASSDLTHYGPSYRFTPAGIGKDALDWAKANDRRLLDRVMDLAADQIVPEAKAHANACGAGAIAAMLAACRDLGAGRASVLRHANSYETLADVAPQQPIDAVGYASVVVG
jgi:AmmeMemoRadiSam system protein B